MLKSPEAFRTISEVADLLDVPAHVLRFWETRFTQVKPVKRGGGRRYYRPDDVRLLRGIRGLLYDDGLTIKGVQKILREQGIRHVIALGTLANVEDIPPPPPREAPRPEVKVAKAPEPALAAAGAGFMDGVPQADLFDGTVLAAETVAGPSIGAIDRDALRRLVGELESLREVMVGAKRA